MKKRYFNILFVILVLCSMFLLSDRSVEVMNRILNIKTVEERPLRTIVIDAGHGGFDPGKIGKDGVLEKDINLAIAIELQELLEQNDFTVIMIRDTDMGHYAETDTNKKVADLRKRVQIIAESNPVLAVSIHQNSFPQESSHGAQVFYYGGSQEGKAFARIMQETIKECINDGNHRKEKANQDYYLLKKTLCPLVIVECGFLSNSRESQLLTTPDYQRKMAWAIHLGVIRYLNSID